MIERKSLAELVDNNDNLMVSEDGQSLLITLWNGRKRVVLAQTRLDDLFDGEGNYFERDV